MNGRAWRGRDERKKGIGNAREEQGDADAMEQIERVNSKRCKAEVSALEEPAPMSPPVTLAIGEIDTGPVNNVSGRALHTTSS